ncbi:MAG: hypothetical protein AAFN63_04095 [Pseudomonadota bacterium]
MNVLGWTGDTKVPPDAHPFHHGGWTALLAPSDSTKTPHVRLAMQVSWFDAGFNFIPVAPAQQLTPTDLTDAACLGNLNTVWQNIGGHGQFCLAVRPRDEDGPMPSQGRAWLQARKAQQDQERQHKTLLDKIVTGLNLPANACQQGAHRASSAILVPRNAAQKTRQAIAEIAQKLETPQDVTLVVSGLWPPLGFTQNGLGTA